ncbi:MAG: hypothetical protein U0412_09765 [Nitrospira sp.]
MTTKQGSYPARWTLWVLLWAAPAAAAAVPEATQVPDTDFLEFLGSWHTGEDRWVDPFRAADVAGRAGRDTQAERQRGQVQEMPQGRRRDVRDESDRRNSRPVDPGQDVKP